MGVLLKASQAQDECKAAAKSSRMLLSLHCTSRVKDFRLAPPARRSSAYWQSERSLYSKLQVNPEKKNVALPALLLAGHKNTSVIAVSATVRSVLSTRLVRGLVMHCWNDSPCTLQDTSWRLNGI